MNYIDIVDELSQNFIDFSYEANSCRAFADARDGLKPGQRACLWEMYTNGYTSNKPHVKSAKIDGGVAAKWWPHGTTAIYETFARMSQDWINNIPEVDWHGGNGSIIISGEPAADRYTEARLSKATEEGMLQGIKKKNVKMIPNFSEDDYWPEVLPAIMPRLLINGCQGIGMTIANTWLPHELADVTEVIKNYALNGTLDFSSLYPSFPTGGIIINKNEIIKIYETGKGKVVLRARTEIQGNSILITELPYQVYAEPLVQKIKDLIKEEQFPEIIGIDNKTSKNKLLIEIECSDNPGKVLRELFQATDLQKNYSANQWALVGKTPKLLNLKEYIDIYLAHNVACVKQEYDYDIKKAKARLEILEGLIKALEDIDNIIKLIKQSDDPEKDLIRAYGFTERQATAIADMKLRKLSRLEKIELNQEKEELTSNLESWQNIISSESQLKNVVIDRLTAFTQKYGKPRRTEVTQIEIEKKGKEKPVIVPKDCVVIINKKGVAKRIEGNGIKAKKRNSVGIKNHGDITVFSQKTNTQDTLLIFTTKGKMYRILIDNLPEGNSGTPLAALIEFEKDELPITYTTLTQDTANKSLFFATKKGMVKKVSMEEYNSVKRSGTLSIKLKEGDELVAVDFLEDEDIVIATKRGRVIKFQSAQIPMTSRTAQGVIGIKLDEGDEVVSAQPVPADVENLVIVSENGMGKKFKLKNMVVQSRAGKGVVYSKERVAGAVLTNEDSSIFISGDVSSLVIKDSDIPHLVSKTAVGNIMIKNNKKIMSICKI